MKKTPPVKFIATSEESEYYGEGETPDAAISAFRTNVLNEGWDDIPVNDIIVFEVQRKGRAKLSVEWVSE